MSAKSLGTINNKQGQLKMEQITEKKNEFDALTTKQLIKKLADFSDRILKKNTPPNSDEVLFLLDVTFFNMQFNTALKALAKNLDIAKELDKKNEKITTNK